MYINVEEKDEDEERRCGCSESGDAGKMEGLFREVLYILM